MVRRPVTHGPLEVVVSASEIRGSFHPYGTDQGPFQTPGTDRDFPESGSSGSYRQFPESGNSGPVPQGVEQARIRSTRMEHARIRSIGVERSPNFLS